MQLQTSARRNTTVFPKLRVFDLISRIEDLKMLVKQVEAEAHSRSREPLRGNGSVNLWQSASMRDGPTGFGQEKKGVR